MLKGIIFDLDGTLVNSHYDWKLIRTKIGVGNIPILSYINGLNGTLKKRALRILESFEKTATKNAELNKGVPSLLSYLSKKGIRRAIVTNNSRKNVKYLLRKWDLVFDTIVTRDDGIWKPSGKPLELALERLGLRTEEIVFVGDSNPDRIAAEAADIRFISINDAAGIEAIYSFIEDDNHLMTL